MLKKGGRTDVGGFVQGFQVGQGQRLGGGRGGKTTEISQGFFTGFKDTLTSYSSYTWYIVGMINNNDFPILHAIVVNVMRPYKSSYFYNDMELFLLWICMSTCSCFCFSL